MTETSKKDASLVQKLARIQRELKAPKNQYNSFGKYNYRNCEDIMEAVKPFLEDLILIVSDDIVQVGERYYVKATASLIDTNEKVLSNTAFARESETKAGMDSAQITGAASSYARKYALNGLLAIDDTKDADSQDNSQKTKATPKTVKTELLEEDVQERRFFEEEGKPVRDSLGHTACIACGAQVSKKVEEYSMQNYGKVLCMPCQAKERGKGK
jgi:hypothetical protein